MFMSLVWLASGKGDFKSGAAAVAQRDGALELLGERGDELHAEGFGVAEVEVLREADAVVGDAELQLRPRARFMEMRISPDRRP